MHDDEDVVIRPTPNSTGERTTWMLSRPTGSTIAVKMRLEPTREKPKQRVHPGHDWFFVLDGQVRLSLGEREITVETGEAAEFTTMTPHAFAATDGPAELIMIFDREANVLTCTTKPLRRHRRSLRRNAALRHGPFW